MVLKRGTVKPVAIAVTAYSSGMSQTRFWTLRPWCSNFPPLGVGVLLSLTTSIVSVPIRNQLQPFNICFRNQAIIGLVHIVGELQPRAIE